MSVDGTPAHKTAGKKAASKVVGGGQEPSRREACLAGECVRKPRGAERVELVGCAGGRGKLGEARVVERSDSQAIDNMRVDRRTPLYAAPPHASSLQP